MKTYPVKVTLAGAVKPPQDLDKAARLTLGERYEEFVKTHPNFTPQQLVKFTEQ